MSQRVLTEIWIYPIKSLAGIRLPKASVMGKGLRYDRRWMLVDDQGRFLTQREHPEMALFSISMTTDSFHILSHQKSTKGSSILLPFENKKLKTAMKVQIWDDEVNAEEVDPNLSNWFSECLTLPCKLVFFPETNTRHVDINYAKQNDQVSLADAYPYLIIGESSLADLNEKLEDPIHMNRFRPNFVFTGGQAFEEDHWNNFRIGSIP
ncbi:MAG TPA: MOSC N-terminal beta barrel domain-containing protein, partial [Cyclobacteriaceae bacterium]|nr:MOSC N-terminal beta barrel domain-containing protein [Cyclobacteriaceae bacterium]